MLTSRPQYCGPRVLALPPPRILALQPGAGAQGHGAASYGGAGEGGLQGAGEGRRDGQATAAGRQGRRHCGAVICARVGSRERQRSREPQRSRHLFARTTTGKGAGSEIGRRGMIEDIHSSFGYMRFQNHSRRPGPSEFDRFRRLKAAARTAFARRSRRPSFSLPACANSSARIL